MRNQLGQSLVELMVSIVIITTALSGVVAIFPYIIQKNASIDMQEKAINILQNEIERLRALRYYDEELDAFGTIEGMSTIKAAEDHIVRITVKYVNPTTAKAPEVYPSDLTEDTGLKEVTVSVKRKNNVGSQVNLVTYISKAKAGKS